MYVVNIWEKSSAHALGVSVVWHLSLPLMNSFNKTEAAFFSCMQCFLRAFPFISLIRARKISAMSDIAIPLMETINAKFRAWSLSGTSLTAARKQAH